MTLTRMIRFVPLAFAPVLLAGCISFGAEAPPSLLTLTPRATLQAGSAVQATESSAIAVAEPGVPQKISVTRVPVQVDETTIAYLKDAVWVERPARLFQQLLAETLRARGNTVVVDGDDPEFLAATQLRGTLREFGYDAQAGSVVVRFDAVRGGGTEPVQTRRFESTVPVISGDDGPEPGPVGEALNQAANDVAAQVTDWVR
ncbi:ABC-type transport auxiliary lipoprotein family protein [Qipengyuania sp. JC766]|uniref:ABC-type transport auxiliary lipoprotein family protein n=1 Tax=Qipengyuania sp. JC766 TaxID=3232139 RepID=UPI003459FF1E